MKSDILFLLGVGAHDGSEKNRRKMPTYKVGDCALWDGGALGRWSVVVAGFDHDWYHDIRVRTDGIVKPDGAGFGPQDLVEFEVRVETLTPRLSEPGDDVKQAVWMVDIALKHAADNLARLEKRKADVLRFAHVVPGTKVKWAGTIDDCGRISVPHTYSGTVRVVDRALSSATVLLDKDNRANIELRIAAAGGPVGYRADVTATIHLSAVVVV